MKADRDETNTGDTPMRFLLGTACFTIALLLFARARGYRERVLARFGGGAFERLRIEARRQPRSLASFGEIARPFVMFGLFYLAIRATLAFVEFDGTRTLSWFDLAGFLALLAGYGVWFTVRAKYALPPSIVDRELERSLDEHIGRGGSPSDSSGPASRAPPRRGRQPR